MIGAKNENGKFSIAVKLIGKNKSVVKDFYLDTGFDGYLKIDKKLFNDLELEKIREEFTSFANGSSEIADIGLVKFEVDKVQGQVEVRAVGWGGRNLLGTRFLALGNMILILDNIHGMHLSTDRELASRIGKTIYEYYKA